MRRRIYLQVIVKITPYMAYELDLCFVQGLSSVSSVGIWEHYITIAAMTGRRST